METESFDNKIKNKLQQYNPKFQEQDWEQFAPLLRMQNTWWKRRRVEMTYAAAALILLLLSFQNYSLWERNRHLQDALSGKTVVNTSEPVVRDTIYITRDNYIYRNQPRVGKSTLANHEKKQGDSFSRIIINRPAQEDDIITNSEVDTSASAFRSVTGTEIASGSTSIDNLKNETAANFSEKKMEAAATNHDSSSTSTSQTAFSLAQNAGEAAKAPAIKTPLKKAQAKRSNIAVGISSLFRENFLAMGIGALYTRGRHFQVAAGLQYGQGFHELFRDNDEFREHHYIDFKDKFNQPLPSSVKFTDIHSRTRQWSLPVALYYKYPLKKGLEAFAGAGIAVDLFTAQNYAYQYTENGNATLRGRLPIQQAGLRLNHVHLSTGVQINIKSLIVRTEPILIMANGGGRFENEFRVEPSFRTTVLYSF